MKTYAQEIRQKAVNAFIQKSLTVPKIVEVFGCSISTLYRWTHEYITLSKTSAAVRTGRNKKYTDKDVLTKTY